MKLKKKIDLVSFVKKVKECESEVCLVTEDGDRLDLKSALAQYVLVTLSKQETLLENSEIICSLEDEKQLADFLERR